MVLLAWAAVVGGLGQLRRHLMACLCVRACAVCAVCGVCGVCGVCDACDCGALLSRGCKWGVPDRWDVGELCDGALSLPRRGDALGDPRVDLAAGSTGLAAGGRVD